LWWIQEIGVLGQVLNKEGTLSCPSLGVIEVIYAAPRGTAVAGRRGVLIVALVRNCLGEQPPEKKMKIDWDPITLNDNDLEGTI